MRADWATQNRPALVRYLRALLRTLDRVYAQKDGFVPIASRILNLEPRYAAVGWDTYAGKRIWPRDGRPTMNGIAKILDILAEQGTFAGVPVPAAAEFVDLSYVDLSYVEEAQRGVGRGAP